ncbi:DMT family transporter [Pokkaliibacter sp. CJK22405]|uniref:DMT family transporter n=1 Tax=Pokkaliibacter sp. CJK22405 TaxID=3384615 RepID=UPI0039848CF0
MAQVEDSQVKTRATLALFIAMWLWSSSFIALKYAFASFDPFFVIWGRMAVASLCFLLLAPWVFKGCHYQRGDWKYLIGMSLFEPCLYFIFEAMALQNTTASQAGMITAMLPVLVAAGAAFFLGERMSRQAYAGFAVALLGSVWLSLAGTPEEGAPNPILGNFFEFLAMLCATGYVLVLKHLTKRYSSFFLTAMQAFCGTVFFLPFVLFRDAGWPTQWQSLPTFAIIYLGTMVTLGAYGLYNYGVSKVEAAKATAFINLIPVFTLILAWALLGETLSFIQTCASALVLIGVITSQVRLSRKAVPLVEGN